MKVRRAVAADFAAATTLLEELGRAKVTPETREECERVYAAQLADPESAPLVGEDAEGQVVAFCTLHFRPRLNHPTPDAWIPDLIVTERSRRRGAARALLEMAERLARERGCWALTLESGYRREEAHQLYEAFGMRAMGKYFAKGLG